MTKQPNKKTQRDLEEKLQKLSPSITPEVLKLMYEYIIMNLQNDIRKLL